MKVLRRFGLRGRSWRFLRRCHAYFAYGRSFLHRQSQILQMWPGVDVELGKDVALFVHFDRRGKLADHVITYVRALHDQGFSVVFVTNSGRQDHDSLNALKPLCRAVVVRRNVGYDFGAVREMLDLLALPRAETQRLLIANDSVYGPLVPMTDMFARVDFDVADLWGATESWQHRYHLQSYFLLAGRRAMTSGAWHRFWKGVRPVSSKQWAINRYEMGLTQDLLRAGLRCRALWPYHELLGRCTVLSALPDLEIDRIGRARAGSYSGRRAYLPRRGASGAAQSDR